MSNQSSLPPQWVNDDKRLDVLRLQIAVAEARWQQAKIAAQHALDVAVTVERHWRERRIEQEERRREYIRLLEERDSIRQRVKLSP